MKIASKKGWLLLICLLAVSVLSAKEKMMIVVQKSDVVNMSFAQELLLKSAMIMNSTEKYEIFSDVELKKNHDREFEKSREASDNDFIKIGARNKADVVLALVLQVKTDKMLYASARLLNVEKENLLAYNRLEYSYGISEFLDKGLAGLLDPLISGKASKIPQGTLVVKTNDQIKLFVDKKRVKDSFFGNLQLSEGYHEVYLQREDGYNIDKKNVFFSENGTITYDYSYTPKSDGITKSLLLPGWGHFAAGRNAAGSLYSGAAVGGLALLSVGIMNYNSSKSDYDDAKSQSETATLYADRLAAADKANTYRDDCTSANNLVMAGAAILALSYIGSFLDIYFTGAEHKLDIEGNDNPFGSNLKINGNSLVYSFGLNSSDEKHRDKQ